MVHSILTLLDSVSRSLVRRSPLFQDLSQNLFQGGSYGLLGRCLLATPMLNNRVVQLEFLLVGALNTLQQNCLVACGHSFDSAVSEGSMDRGAWQSFLGRSEAELTTGKSSGGGGCQIPLELPFAICESCLLHPFFL